jgi:hypothetical protein
MDVGSTAHAGRGYVRPKFAAWLVLGMALLSAPAWGQSDVTVVGG